MQPVLKTSRIAPVLAASLPLAACLLQWLCWPVIAPFVWFLFYPVVFLSPWLGGSTAGLAATGLSTALVWWFFMAPVHVLVKPASAAYLNAAMFMAMGCLFTWFHGRLRRATQRAAAAERSARDELLDRTSRLAKVGGWAFDVATLQGSWTGEVARIHDLDPSAPVNVHAGLGYYHEEDRPVIAEAVRRSIEEARPYDLEARLVSAKGAAKWVRTIGHPVIKDGRVVEVHGALQDITGQKQLEMALRDSEAHFRSLFEQAGVGVVEVDAATGAILRANGKFCEILGYPPAELLAMTFQEVTHPEERDRDSAQIERLKKRELPEYNVEKRYLRKDGSIVWAALTVRPLNLAAGLPERNVSIVADITARKQAEAEILELNATLERRVAERTAELQASNRELETFAYAASHDLRAPLQAIGGFSQALLEDCGKELGGNGRSHLEHILRATSRMAGLIDGLLTLSRAARCDMQQAPVDLSALAEAVLADLASNDPEREVRIQVEPGIRVQGDPRLLEAAMANLLGNAWKYTSKTPGASIAVAAGLAGGMRTVRISDNGCGFDMQFAGKLFQPFQRLHRQDEFPGIGIGLATVHRIVQRHGGELVAASSPGHGATFSMTLPWAA